MNGKKLSKKWLYTFIGIAFVALATCTAALYYKEYIIATGTGSVSYTHLTLPTIA